MKGGFMDHGNINAPGDEKETPSPSTDSYKVGTYTMREQVVLGIKLFAICGVFFFFFWLVEKLHFYL
jgi:hypothetical protein